MNSPLQRRRLLTIICEGELERTLVADLQRLGARGHTITEARGHGTHGDRDGLWPSSANIRVEVLCDEVVCAALLDVLEKRYFESYGVVVFVSDVQVLRPEKF